LFLRTDTCITECTHTHTHYLSAVQISSPTDILLVVKELTYKFVSHCQNILEI